MVEVEQSVQIFSDNDHFIWFLLQCCSYFLHILIQQCQLLVDHTVCTCKRHVIKKTCNLLAIDEYVLNNVCNIHHIGIYPLR